jgi:hypothetical protein
MWQAGGERVSVGIQDAVSVPFPPPLREMMGHEQKAEDFDGYGRIGDFLHEPFHYLR